MKSYLVADLFCGAGGSSTGAERAVRTMGGRMELVCVNHWPVAVETHQRNHPTARHYCVDLDSARPEDLVPEGKLDLLMASPECVFFSRARGGKPVSDQRRMSAWHVQRWCTALDVRAILIENVPEFMDWAPLLSTGRPDPTKRGLYFQAWRKALVELGYDVDFRILNAADFGDATTRRRLFVQARKDGQPIKWPTASHSPTGAGDMFGGRKRWRAAREVIDWDNPGRSLLDDPKYHKKPLSLKTRQRIARGLERFGGPLAPLYIALLGIDAPAEGPASEPAPFIAVGRENNVPRSVDEPLQTITTSPAMFVVQPTAEPFVIRNNAHAVAKAIDEPIPTATGATGGGSMLVSPRAEPFVLGQQSGSVARDVADPLPTIATGGAISMIRPMLAAYYGGSEGCSSVESPLPTVTTKDRFGLVTPTAAPFLVPNFGERDGQEPRVHSVEDPLPAVTSHGAGNLVAPVLIQTDQTGWAGVHARSLDVPIPTVCTKQAMALAEPLLTPGSSIDPRRVVEIDGVPHVLDIRFRMLSNRELARATGFDDQEAQYEFVGTVQEVTRQIGNAVPCHLAAALVTAILDDTAQAKRKSETAGVAA